MHRRRHTRVGGSIRKAFFGLGIKCVAVPNILVYTQYSIHTVDTLLRQFTWLWPTTESECNLETNVTLIGRPAMFIFPGVSCVGPVVNGLCISEVKEL